MDEMTLQQSSLKETNEEEQYKDIIKELTVRGVQQCIAHKILEHLDYSSLKNASLISADWCKAIKIGNIWQKLFERNVEFDSVWRRFYERDKIFMFQLIGPRSQDDSTSLFQQYCDYIHQCQEDLMRNWRQGSFAGAAVIDGEQCYHIQPFAMDQSRFVNYIAAQEQFYVIKRWHQTFEKTIPCPKTRVEDFKLSSGILVAVCFTMDGQYRGSIRVWNVDTAQLVHVFDDSLKLRDSQLRFTDSPTFRMHLSECGRYLATYVSVSQFGTTATASNDKRLLTLRKFKTPEQVSVVHQIHHHHPVASPNAADNPLSAATQQLVITKSLFVDSRYVILFFKMITLCLSTTAVVAPDGRDELSIGNGAETIEIRSNLTFELLQSIAVPLSSILLHYSNSFLMLSLLDSCTIEFLSAESGTCVGTMRLPTGLQCASIRARLIGDQFVFVYCLRGFVRVYDLQSLLFVNQQQKKEKKDKEEGDECLYQFEITPEEGPMSHLVTDQCQVYLFGSNPQQQGVGIGIDSPRKVYVAGLDFSGSDRPQLTNLFPSRL